MQEKDLTLDLELVEKLLNEYNIAVVQNRENGWPTLSSNYIRRLPAALALLLTALRLLQSKLEKANEAHAKTKEWANSEMKRTDELERQLEEANEKIEALLGSKIQTT